MCYFSRVASDQQATYIVAYSLLTFNPPGAIKDTTALTAVGMERPAVSQRDDLKRLVGAVDRAIRQTNPVPSRMNRHLYDVCACGGPKSKVAHECQWCHRGEYRPL